MAEVAILKTVKSPYLSNRLTDFDEIWHADADWPTTGDRSLKFSIFQKKMAAVVIFKNHTNPDITTRNQQGIDRSSRNLAWLCKMCLLSAQIVNKLNFQNPRWRTAAIVKTVKPPYLRNCLTDFDEIWYGDWHWPRTWDRPLKFWIFENPRWQNESNNLQPKVKQKYWYVKWSVLHVHKFKRKKIKKANINVKNLTV